MNIKQLISKKNTIEFKLLFVLIVFSLFILISLWGSQNLFFNYFYEKYQIADVEKIAVDISNIDSSNLDSYLKNVVYNNSVCIEYDDYYGNSILYNDASAGCLLGKDRIDLSFYKNKLIKSNIDKQGIKLVNPDYESYALLYGVKVDDGYIFIFTMLSNVNKNFKIINTQYVYILFFVILVAMIISIFLSHMISAPIQRITEQSRMVANGNYNVVFEKNGIDEIDSLVDSLNYLESEVSKTDQYRRDLMANVSHDLKTPLTMIRAYAEMVRDITYKDKDKREENLNVIIAETERLNTLVEDILTLSKMQSNSDVLNIEVFNLKDEVLEILKRYDVVCLKEGYNIVFNSVDNVMIKADRKKLNQVIYNLINNAINYTGEDKTIYIDITEDKKYFSVEIRDTGKGIDKDKIKNIWDRYYKNDKNHKRNVVGTGLGLSIVKNILELHGFIYGVKSKKGNGTSFYFKINKK